MAEPKYDVTNDFCSLGNEYMHIFSKRFSALSANNTAPGRAVRPHRTFVYVYIKKSACVDIFFDRNPVQIRETERDSGPNGRGKMQIEDADKFKVWLTATLEPL